MLKQHLHYQDNKKDERNEEKEREEKEKEEKIANPNLKQFFDAQTKIEPFYSGGKLLVLSPCHFICQCGSSLRIISTAEEIKKEETNNKKDEEPMDVDDDQNENINEGGENKKTFNISGHFDVELDEIISFDACPKSLTLITAHKSNLIRTWNLQTGDIEKTIKSPNTFPIKIVEINKYESFINYSKIKSEPEIEIDVENQDKVVRDKLTLTWATISGSFLRVWKSSGNEVSKGINIGNVTTLGFVKWDDKKNRLFAAERNIYVIEPTVNKSIDYNITHTLEGHYSQVTGIEFGNDFIISGGRDKIIILWSKTTLKKIKTVPFPAPIESLILLGAFNDLYVALSPSDIRHFDVKKSVLSSTVLPLKDETNLSFHPFPVEYRKMNQFFLSTHTSAIYHLEKPSIIDNNLAFKKQYVGSLDEILAVAIWGDTKFAVANNTSIIKVYDRVSYSCEFLRGHEDIVLTLAVKEIHLLSGSKDNKIIIWSMDSMSPLSILEGHISSVSRVCFGPKSHLYSVSEDNFLKMWNFDKCIKSVVAHEKDIHAVQCSPNENYVVTGSRDKTAKLWNANTLKLEGTFKGHKKTVWDARFSKWDQKLIVTSSADTTLKIWDIYTFDCIKTLQDHQSSVLQGIFINSGLQILSSSSDGTFKSWEIKSSACISTLECSDDKIWALDSSEDGSLVVTGSADSVLTVWKDITEEKVKLAIEKQKKIIESEQLLINVIKKEHWEEAIKLSIEMDKPFTLLKIIREMPDIKELNNILVNLEHDYIISLMRYVKKWNTNSRTSTEAQLILNILLKHFSPKEVDFVDLKAIQPYTEKHFQRLQKTRQYVTIIKYISQRIQNDM